MAGLTHNSSSAVICRARPIGVLNHGIPAYGYAPSAVSVSNIAMSADDRRIQRLNASFDVTIDEVPGSANDRFAVTSSYRGVKTRSLAMVQTIDISRSIWAWAAR